LSARDRIDISKRADFLREIVEQRAVVRTGIERLSLNHFVAGVENERKNKPRSDHTFVFTRLQISDELIEQFRDRIQARDVRFRVLHAVNLVNVNQERRNLRVHTAHLADRINIEAKPKLLRFTLRLSLEEFVTQLRLWI